LADTGRPGCGRANGLIYFGGGWEVVMADADVVVIGAGCGGLTAAAYLARAGRRVRVIDARNNLGGHMSAFTVDGYEFDTGMHYTEVDLPRALLSGRRRKSVASWLALREHRVSRGR
jgi:cation diffusion facilitator CzcD-associated flavoprotein CzcO